MIEVLGLLLPPVIDIINRRVSDSDKRLLISVFICALVGVIMNYITTNGFHGYTDLLSYADGIGKSIIMVFGFAQLSFQGYWRNTETHKSISQ